MQERTVPAETVRKIFSEIPTNVIVEMGLDPILSNPKDFFITHLPVSPRCTRPPTIPTTQRFERPLTMSYKNVVADAERIEATRAHNPASRYKVIGHFNIDVAALIDRRSVSEVIRFGLQSNIVQESLGAGLEKKEGLMRKNIQGKRIEQVARTPISPDPSLEPDQIGVPIAFCKKLVVHEIVNSYNLEKLSLLVNNGPNMYPGALYIVNRRNGTLKSLTKFSDSTHLPFILTHGDIVHRHLMMDDIVLVGRQPTLHKHSITALRVVPVPHSSIGLNPVLCTQYNADFDGDDMNLYVLRTYATMAEAELLCGFSSQVISWRHSAPIIGAIQDPIIGAFGLTRDSSLFALHNVCFLLRNTKRIEKDLPPPIEHRNGVPLWSGRQIVSMLLPPISVSLTTNAYKTCDRFGTDTEKRVVIKNGTLIKGIIDKASIGAKASNSVLHVVFSDFGAEAFSTFLHNICQVTYNFNQIYACSIGVQDLALTREMRAEIKKQIAELRDFVNKTLLEIDVGHYPVPVGVTVRRFFEDEAMRYSEKTRVKIVSKVLDSIDLNNNRFAQLVLSGAKGSLPNIGQMLGSIGVQNILGKLVQPDYDGTRTLPDFPPYDVSPESWGFGSNAFVTGLSATELFFHAMAARIGIIDTGLKTRESGYEQRIMIKMSETLIVCYDLTVRNTEGKIIQYIYNGNGISPSHYERVRLDILSTMSFKDFEKKYKFVPRKGDSLKLIKLGGAEFLRINILRTDALKILESTVKAYTTPHEVIQTSIPVERIVTNILSQRETVAVEKKYEKLVSLKYCARKIVDLVSSAPNLFCSNHVSENALGEIYRNATKSLELVVRSYLYLNKIRELELTTMEFDLIIYKIRESWIRSFISPGEAVGLIASTSLGEAGTQLTLDTFHYAGIGEHTDITTKGLPRFRQLMNVKRVLDPSEIFVHLDKTLERTKPISELKTYASTLEFYVNVLTLKTLTSHAEFCLCPWKLNTPIQPDKDIISSFLAKGVLSKLILKQKSFLPLILRIHISKFSLLKEKITMMFIKRRIEDEFPYLYIVPSKESAMFPILLGFIDTSSTVFPTKYLQKCLANVSKFLADLLDFLLSDLVIRGIPGIYGAVIESKHTYNVDERTGDLIKTNTAVVHANGNDIDAVALSPYADPLRVETNDLYKTYLSLGIEAARTKLIEEMYLVHAEASSYVNYTHFELIADLMSFTGELLSMHRGNMEKREISPIVRISFETALDMIYTASVFGQKDNMLSPSANVLAGQACVNGSGSFNLAYCTEQYGITNDELISLFEQKEKKKYS
jgi:DNA-directed RNA polymerase II subunit RPB1